MKIFVNKVKEAFMRFRSLWTPEQVRRGGVVIAALFLFITTTAFAATDKFTPDTMTPDKMTPDKITPDKMAIDSMSIKLTDCQMFAEYQPSKDADYKDVDAAGKPVTPADISPSPIKLPEKYSFDLNIDTAQRLGMTVPAGSQGLMKAGTVTIDKDGNATFNGQPMEDKALTALKAACAAKTAKIPPK